MLTYIPPECVGVFILICERVYCCKIHMRECMQTRVDMHTGDLYQQLIDQCLMRLGVLPL